jgi:serine/threonine-protein phosphatase 2A regulatory subunit A
LIPILESLASFEETVVREQACEALTSLYNKLSEEDIVASIVPAILRLADAAWFTSKVSALNLICNTYEKAGEYKSTLRK